MVNLLVALVVLYLIIVVAEVVVGLHRLTLALDSAKCGQHRLASTEAAEGRRLILFAPIWWLGIYLMARRAWRL